MVPDFVRLGFTAATPLPNQGFPARFLVWCIRSAPDNKVAIDVDMLLCFDQASSSISFQEARE